MIANHIVEDKWRVQRVMSDQAGNDPRRYLALTHSKVAEAEQCYQVKFRYATTKGPARLTSPEGQ